MPLLAFLSFFLVTAESRAGSTQIVQVTAGAGHSCVLRGNGEVLCWGNPGERFGREAEPPSTSDLMAWSQPKTIDSVPRDVASIDAGGYHTCAMTRDGEVWCWGEGRDGQLGKASGTPRRTARRVMRGAQAVSAGGAHSCAIQGDGTLWCWGANNRGQLGTGAAGEAIPKPRRVAGLSEVVEVSAGHEHTCARTASGLFCWGRNDVGQVGVKGEILKPKRVAGVSARSVSAGGTLTCVVTEAGRETCFGEKWIGNPHGEMNEIMAAPGRPGRSSLRGTQPEVIRVEAGAEVACALDASELLQCWTYGRVHTTWPGQWGFQRPNPKVRSFAVGWEHACAVTPAGELSCWGENRYGQLGNGRVHDGTKPERVPGIRNAIQVVAGRRHSCALLREGSVRCWGWNTQGALGVDGPERQPVPQPVPDVSKVVSLNTSDHTTCALRSDGKVQCWGSNQLGTLTNGTRSVEQGAVFSKVRDATHVGAGSGATCITGNHRKVRCWGNSGVLGGGKGGRLVTLPEVEQVLPGSFDWGCLRTASGNVHCWNDKQGYKPASKKLIQVEGLPPATDLDVYGCTACVVLQDGSVRCRGNGQTCDSEKSRVFVPRFSKLGATEVAVGASHQCARTSSGEVWCRGKNFEGQLGTGDYVSSDVPKKVVGIEKAVSIGAGESHSCAVVKDGSVWCWGTNDHGELGQRELGATLSTYREPVRVRGL